MLEHSRVAHPERTVLLGINDARDVVTNRARFAGKREVTRSDGGRGEESGAVEVGVVVEAGLAGKGERETTVFCGGLQMEAASVVRREGEERKERTNS